ncbi:MAG TPA: alpha/beta fold hydrolase [Longimicrobiales bacterium]|nr:alpha/beta fold hydrolase [Longimicrobiales bacterium]
MAPVTLPGTGVEGVAAYLASAEASLGDVVPGAEKAVRWADPLSPAVTGLSVVYLHGFSATRQEVAPLPEELASALDANLFLTRLAGHGRTPEAMGEATVQHWLQDGEEAMAVGTRVGQRVILVGTSTGGTLALWMASRPRWRERVAAVLLISPNLGVRDRRSALLTWPWGGVLARAVIGPEYSFPPRNEGQARYWTHRYPVEALLPMAALVKLVDGVDLDGVRVPVFVAYSPHDEVVDPARIEVRFRELGGARELMAVTVHKGGDTHVLAGDILSPQGTGPLLEGMLGFLDRAGVAPERGPPRAVAPGESGGDSVGGFP